MSEPVFKGKCNKGTFDWVEEGCEWNKEWGSFGGWWVSWERKSVWCMWEGN